MKKTPRDVGTSAVSGVAHVSDLMTADVLTATRHETLGTVRERMASKGIHSLPVVNGEGEPIGILTSMDILEGHAPEALVGQVMTSEVVTIPQYAGIHQAARSMRNHHIHHLVVTHEKKVVGVISSFDLLRLVENKRFVEKGATASTRKTGKRAKKES